MLNNTSAAMILEDNFDAELPDLNQIAVNKKTGSPVKLESRVGNPDAGWSQYLAQERLF